MSLTRFLPIPSDRMGILWTLLSINDAIILEYGTSGTSAYASKLLQMSGNTIENRLFTTSMNEDNVVMGDTKILEEKIKYLDKKYRPKVIFVMASSVSSVIGADVKGVVNLLQDDVKAKLISFTEGGFGSDYSKGLELAYTKIVKEICVKQYDVEKTFNIIGVSSIDNSTPNDVREIKSMMEEYFDLSANTILSYQTTINQIEVMSRASINLVLSYEGLESAKILNERFGTPYVYGLPLGYKGTNKWLNNIARELECDISRKILESPVQKTSFEKAVIYSGYDKAVALEIFLKELGIKEVTNISTHNIKKAKDKTGVKYFKTEREKLDIFKNLNKTLILGDNTLSKTANGTNHHICVNSLLVDNNENNTSILGLKGATYLINRINNI